MSRSGFMRIHMNVVSIGLLRLFLALDEAQKIWLSAMEVRMLEVPGFCIAVTSEDSLLQMRNLVEAIHIQLTHEGRKLLMLEPTAEDFSRKAFMIENYDRISYFEFSANPRERRG